MLNLAKKEEWQSYVRLLKYCLPYKKRLAYAIACMVLSAIFGIIRRGSSRTSSTTC